MAERLWFKIGEAAESAGVSARDIRYWEKVIPEIRPRRSNGNLRYFHKDDLPKLQSIASWINQGFSVADCRELLLTGGINRRLGLDIEWPETEAAPEKTPKPKKSKPKVDAEIVELGETSNKPATDGKKTLPAQQLQDVIDALKELLARLQKPI